METQTGSRAARATSKTKAASAKAGAKTKAKMETKDVAPSAPPIVDGTRLKLADGALVTVESVDGAKATIVRDDAPDSAELVDLSDLQDLTRVVDGKSTSAARRAQLDRDRAQEAAVEAPSTKTVKAKGERKPRVTMSSEARRLIREGASPETLVAALVKDWGLTAEKTWYGMWYFSAADRGGYLPPESRKYLRKYRHLIAAEKIAADMVVAPIPPPIVEPTVETPSAPAKKGDKKSKSKK